MLASVVLVPADHLHADGAVPAGAVAMPSLSGNSRFSGMCSRDHIAVEIGRTSRRIGKLDGLSVTTALGLLSVPGHKYRTLCVATQARASAPMTLRIVYKARELVLGGRHRR